MLRARLVDSISSPGVTAVLHNPEAQKLLVAKENGDIEVYSRENDCLRLFQTYPNLLQNSHTDETRINGLYDAGELSTVFARCEKSLLLFNSTNLHKYDQIVDRRGIDNCWIFEVSLPTSEEKMTFLVYSTKETAKLRMLIWEGRIYKKISEATLSNDKEVVQSAQSGRSGIILTTSLAIYHWSYGESLLSRIDKIVKPRYPKDLVPSLGELKSMCNSEESIRKLSNSDIKSLVTTGGRVTKKSSIINFWKRDNGYASQPLSKVRYVFNPSPDNYVVLDGITKNYLELKLTPSQLPYIVASNCSQFIEWNHDFSNVQYLSSNLLILTNKDTVRFVDYQNGFIFLQHDIPEHIRLIEKISGCYFVVLTFTHEIQLFHYQVNDDSEDSFDDDESICGALYESDFYQLWRKVLFYNYFLDSPDSRNLCASDDPDRSLDLCAMKLRDLTVMWCLNIYERFQTYMKILSAHNRLDVKSRRLQNTIVENVFDKLIEFWAPPQLIILRAFPPNISRLVSMITGQKHSCLLNDGDDQKTYELPQDLLRKWLLPYLTDARRHFQSMLKQDKITWEFSGRKIEVGIDFFLLDKHQSLDVPTLLTLIDTVLFMTYLYYFPSMVEPLLCVNNMCDYDIVVEELHNRHMFQELVYFYFQKGKHVDALEFLTSLCTSESSHQLQDGIKILVIDYLKKLTQEYLELIFRYTDWLQERFEDPKENILESIFMNDTPACAGRDQYSVYEYIDHYDSKVSLQYLEFAISNFKLQEIRLHTILIRRYFQNLQDPSTRVKLKSVLETTSVYEPRTVLRILEESSDDKTRNLTADQSNFVDFLKIYPLQRLGKFEEAVDILFDRISDYNATSIFCEKAYESNHEVGINILTYFFKKLVASTQGNRNPQIAYFLQEHGSKIEIVSIYRLLPSNLLLHDLKEVLLQTIKSHSIKKDETRIKKSLLHVELIDKSNDLNKKLSNYTIVTEGYRCPVCKKAFSTLITDTALWFTFDGRDVVVHYTCGKALQAKMENKRAKARTRANRTVAELKEKEQTYK